MNRLFGLIIYSLNEGNLTGRWMNSDFDTFQTETVVRNSGNQNDFTGIFQATWRDDFGTFTAALTINRISDDQLELHWNGVVDADQANINTRFRGIGTVVNNQLVCSYIML